MELPRPSWTVERTARVLDCRPEQVRHLIKRGILTGFKLRTGLTVAHSSRWRVFVDSIRTLQGEPGDGSVSGKQGRRRSKEFRRRVAASMLAAGLPPWGVNTDVAPSEREQSRGSRNGKPAPGGTNAE